MVISQLFEQLQAAAVWQHDIEHYRSRRRLCKGASGAGAVMTSAHQKTFLAQPATQKLTKLLVIINK
jgi:hypothetical protein